MSDCRDPLVVVAVRVCVCVCARMCAHSIAGKIMECFYHSWMCTGTQLPRNKQTSACILCLVTQCSELLHKRQYSELSNNPLHTSYYSNYHKGQESATSSPVYLLLTPFHGLYSESSLCSSQTGLCLLILSLQKCPCKRQKISFWILG
jgi:hypothetical protein